MAEGLPCLARLPGCVRRIRPFPEVFSSATCITDAMAGGMPETTVVLWSRLLRLARELEGHCPVCAARSVTLGGSFRA